MNKTYYTSDIPYITSQYIREYDISKANINILLYKKVIDIDTYNFLYKADRMTRQVTIGNMIKNNSDIGEVLKDGIHEMVSKFISINNIEEQDILSVKNDAIFIINKIPNITQFDNIEFKNKNTYTSYINLNNIEIYYCLDSMNSIEKIDVKGIRDEKLKLHEMYFINFLCEYLYNVESNTPSYNLKWFKDFYNMYISLSLDVGYYRAFNAISNIETIPIIGSSYLLSGYNINIDKNIININYNLELLRILYRYLLEMQFQKR